MFRSAPDLSATPPSPRAALRRAAWMASGLIALWLVMQFVPAPTLTTPPPAAPPAHVSSASDFDAGTVARGGVQLREERSGFSVGYLMAVALLGGGAWFALKLRRKGTQASGLAGTLQSLGTLTLTPGQTLHLVACGTDVLLVGQGASGVSLLATYPREGFDAPARVTSLKAVAPEPADVPAPAPPSPSFGELLRARAPHLFAVEEGRAA